MVYREKRKAKKPSGHVKKGAAPAKEMSLRYQLRRSETGKSGHIPCLVSISSGRIGSVNKTRRKDIGSPGDSGQPRELASSRFRFKRVKRKKKYSSSLNRVLKRKISRGKSDDEWQSETIPGEKRRVPRDRKKKRKRDAKQTEHGGEVLWEVVFGTYERFVCREP